MLIFHLHSIYLYLFPVLQICATMDTYQCKNPILPEEGWFGHQKYSTPK